MAGQNNNNKFLIQFSYVAKIPMLIIKSMGNAKNIINSVFTIFFIPPPVLNDNLQGFTPVLDETGKITGYKTAVGGADTVFPFSDFSGIPLEIINAESLSPINGANNQAQNAIDGNFKNYYLADNPTQAEIVFTLKNAAQIKEIHVIGANSTGGSLYIGNVIAYGSNDNINFIQIASAVKCPLFYAGLDLTGLGFTVIPVQDYGIYKYIKLIAYGNYCGFYEVEIMG